MNDFSTMSDDELKSIANGGLRSHPSPSPEEPPDFSKMSDEELNKVAMGSMRKAMPALPKPRGWGDLALDAVVTVGKEIDSVTGAPTRKAIGAAMDGENPLSAFYNQFGENPEHAPTGKDLAKRVGFDDTPLSENVPALYSKTGDEWLKFKKDGPMDWSPAGVAGFAVDVAADPTNFIPGKAVLKGAGKAAEMGKDAIAAGTKGAAKATDFVLGTDKVTKTLDKTGELVGDVAGAVGKAVNPKLAPDYQKFLDIAKKNNIDPALLPEAVEFGPDTFITRASRNVAEGPFGEKRLQAFGAGMDAVRDAIGGKIKGFTGGADALDEIAAGAHLRDAYDRGVENFFNKMDLTHNTVIGQVPRLQLTEDSLKSIDSSLNGIEKFAKGRTKRGFTRAQREQGEQLLAAVEAVRAGNGSYKQMVETLRDIGDVAFASKNSLADIPPDVQKFRKLYNDISEALIGTVKSELGDDIAKSLVDNNKAMTEFFGDKSLLAPVVGAKNLSPEQVFNSIVKNGDSSRLGALKKILSPEDFNQLKGAFLENIIKRSPDGSFTFRGLHNQLRGKKNALSVLFEPGELAQIDELIELGDRFGDPVLSKSGTGASNIFRDLATGLRDGIVNDKTVEIMKSRARGAVDALPTPTAPPAGGMSAAQPKMASAAASIPIFENKIRAAAKGSQSVSTMETNQPPSQDMIARVDANPDFLKAIKSPTLKRNLIEAVNKRRQKRGEDVISDVLDSGFNPKEKTSLQDAKSDFINGN